MSFLMKSDAQSNPNAMNLIGYMYDTGSGVKRNPEKAFYWYQKATKIIPMLK